jgi:GAF domain-containing protein
MARSLAFLFATGATIVSITLLLPHGSSTTEGPLLAAVGIAYVAAVVIWRRREDLPAAAAHAGVALGSALIAVCVWFGGTGASSYGVMYALVAIYAGWYFAPAAVAAHVAWGLGLLAVALVGGDEVGGAQVVWVMVAGTTALVGIVTSDLVARLRGHRDDLSLVAELANGLTDPRRYAAAVCAGLLEAGRADAAALLVPESDGPGLRVAACTGPLELVGRSDEEITACFTDAHRTVLHADARGVVGLAEPVLRDGRPAGVLVAAYRRPRRTLPMRATSAALLFAAQAGVGMERLERLNRDRERRALEINDMIVQGLAVAKYAVEAGLLDEGMRALDDTLAAAKRLATAQLDDIAEPGGIRPGDLVRGRVTGTGTA